LCLHRRGDVQHSGSSSRNEDFKEELQNQVSRCDRALLSLLSVRESFFFLYLFFLRGGLWHMMLKSLPVCWGGPQQQTKKAATAVVLPDGGGERVPVCYVRWHGASRRSTATKFGGEGSVAVIAAIICGDGGGGEEEEGASVFV